MKSRVPKNIGGAQNMNSMIKQAQKMQDEITELQNVLKQEIFQQHQAAALLKLLLQVQKISRL